MADVEIADLIQISTTLDKDAKVEMQDGAGNSFYADMNQLLYGAYTGGVQIRGTAYQEGSIAIGDGAVAGGSLDAMQMNAIAIGAGASADDRFSVAIGQSANANALNATAIGDDAEASEDKAVALGANTAARQTRAICIGFGALVAAGATLGITIGNMARINDANHDNTIVIGADLDSTAANQFTFGDKFLRLGQFAVAGLPAASGYTGHLAYVSNGDSGNPCLAVSNGTNWLRIALGAAVSSS